MPQRSAVCTGSIRTGTGGERGGVGVYLAVFQVVFAGAALCGVYAAPAGAGVHKDG